MINPQENKPKSSIFWENSWKSLLINILLMVLTTILLLLLFFYAFLPSTTNFGESITVPDLEGKTIEQVKTFLEERELRYVIRDTSYSADHQPLVVIAQSPAANAEVKLNRKIYLTINAEKPPQILIKSSIDEIIGRSVSQVKMVLRSYSLMINSKTVYVPNQFDNAVLAIRIDGKDYKQEDIDEGITLPKGTEITLVAGDGLGETKVDMPKVTGLSLDEVEFILSGLGINIDNINYVRSSKSVGTVLNQSVSEGTKVNVGTYVSLTVAGYFPDQAD